MNNIQSLKPSEIQNLITKFYYKDNQLCFQILLQDQSENTTSFQEFSDYTEYKKAYNQLMDLKSGKMSIDTANTNEKESYMVLS